MKKKKQGCLQPSAHAPNGYNPAYADCHCCESRKRRMVGGKTWDQLCATADDVYGPHVNGGSGWWCLSSHGCDRPTSNELN